MSQPVTPAQLAETKTHPGKGGRKLLLVGWDAADWQIIQPLLDAGKMPTLAKLMSEGVSGNLATLSPVLSPMLWTSIATGKRADKHGICGFIEPSPEADGIRPITSTSRRSRAIWNILSHVGWHVDVVNWYASHPAEPINGTVVSNAVPRARRRPDAPSPLPRNAVHPAFKEDLIAQFLVHPSDLTPEQIVPFVPKLGGRKIEDKKVARKIDDLANVLAATATTQAVGTALLELDPWDAAFIYFDAIDHFGHLFMEYRPPRMEKADPQMVEALGNAVDGMYQFHDLMLARQLQFCDDNTTVVICSDHGFLNGDDRPKQTVMQMTGPAEWHRHFGMLVMKGPGIARGQQIFGASVLDIAPTLLALFGLPVGDDMDGRVIESVLIRPQGAFAEAPKHETIASWDTADGDFGEHPADLRIDAIESAEAVKQLVELGYVDAQSENVADQVELAKKELKFNLVRTYLDSYRGWKAAPLAEELAERYPQEARFSLVHAHLLLDEKRIEEAEAIADRLEAMQHAKHPGDTDSRPGPQLLMLRADIADKHGDADLAIDTYRRALELAPESLNVHLSIASSFMKQRDIAAAEQVLNTVLRRHPDQPQALFGLARIAFRRHDFVDTVDYCLRCIEAQTFYAGAHLLLSQALARLGRIDEAIRASLFTVKIHPASHAAHRFLSVLYRQMNADSLAEAHAKQASLLIEMRRRHLEQVLADRDAHAAPANPVATAPD